MNKRQQPFQGGGERYNDNNPDAGSDMADKPQRATAAQMARRTIAAARKPSGSQRSSRAGTPTAFVAPGQQSMASTFQPPAQSGTGFGGDFNFAVDTPSNPFAHTNGASGTPPPAPFQFGGVSNQPQQNGGVGSGLFGNTTTSFGSTFNSSNAQPQQNGFHPSTSLFGQNDSNKATTPSFSGAFGQSSFNQSQQNGVTAGTTNSFPSFGKQNSDNPFKSFQSQPQTQSTTNTPLTSFGQSTQPNGDKPPSTPFTFGQTNTNAPSTAPKPLFSSTSPTEQTPKTAASGIFSGFGQQNGDKPLFTSTSQSEQTPKLGTSNIFGAQQSGAKPLFGATPPPESASHTPKPGESIFSGLGQQKKDGISANMFTQSRDNTPQPSTSNIFGAPAPTSQQSEADAAGQTAKTSNIFGASSQAQPNGVKSSLFSGISTQSEQQTPKPSTGLFSGGFGQQASQPPATPAFKFGQSQQDTSMTTPGNTPQKQIGSSESASQPQASAPEASSSTQAATPGAGLFGSIKSNDDAPATAPKTSFKPQFSMSNAQSTTTPFAREESQQTPAAQGGSLFDRATPREPPATSFKPSFTPSASIVNKPSDMTAAPWISHAPHLANEMAAQQPTAPSAPSQATAATASSKEVIPATEKETLRALNAGLLAHLAKQDRDADWTPILRYCIQQAAKIRKKPAPKFDKTPMIQSSVAASSTTQQKAAPQNVFAALSESNKATAASSGPLFTSATPKAPASTIQQTPKPSSAQSLLKPPQTAPVNRKRPADEDPEHAATDKRPRSKEPTEYPKLPENASETAKLFQAALDKSSNNTPALLKSASEEKETAEKERKEAEGKEKQAELPKFGGFKPSTTGFTPSAPSAPAGGFKPSTAGFTPSATSGMPSFGAPAATTGGFLAAFGKKANAEEEKERKKRKMEDYDSDEETEEAWIERDRIEQQAKRQKILDAAKSGAGFTPSGSAGTTPAPESDFGEGSEKASEKADDTDAETPPLPSKSLFDRIAPRDPPASATKESGIFSSSKAAANSFAPKTPSLLGAGSTTPDLFSHLSKPRESIEISEEDKTNAEKEQGEGDHTWKPNTPIKFGAGSSTAAASTTPAAPPPLGNLFGPTPKPSTDGTGHLNVPKPFHGFNFGGTPSSLATSRASTPGFTTDGEGASTAGEGEDEDEHPSQSEPQVEDQTGLRDTEKENEDLLFSVHMAKAMKWGEKKLEGGDVKPGWVERGKGPLYILKHKETGKVRVVLKVPPYGNARMNFEPLKNVEYQVQGGSGKMVQGIFVDHLDTKNPGAFGKWLLQVGKPEDAKEMAKVLMENRAS